MTDHKFSRVLIYEDDQLPVQSIDMSEPIHLPTEALVGQIWAVLFARRVVKLLQWAMHLSLHCNLRLYKGSYKVDGRAGLIRFVGIVAGIEWEPHSVSPSHRARRAHVRRTFELPCFDFAKGCR